MILAGDVGGTKCNLGLFLQDGISLRSVFQRRFATRDYPGFEDVVEDFLQQAAADKNHDAIGAGIDAAGFGVAGVVLDGRHYSENLPWVVDISVLARKLNLTAPSPQFPVLGLKSPVTFPPSPASNVDFSLMDTFRYDNLHV